MKAREINTKDARIIYPMSMLNEVVGNNRKVELESACYEFDREEPYFHYAEGEVLESLSEPLAKFSISEMGFRMFE